MMTRLEFNNQVLQLSRKLYLTAFRFLHRQDEAEDAVQEVFIRLWTRREGLDKYNSIEALATTSLKNYCIDILRKRKLITNEDQENHKGIPDRNPSPSEAMENNESLQILDKIIQQLPELYREIITLKDIDGYTYDEIVDLTGQNINTLRVNLSRARKMIRDEFKKYRYEYTGSTHSSG
jgi:RNA polymerase sigma-70 factor (ECF subfamily)